MILKCSTKTCGAEINRTKRFKVIRCSDCKAKRRAARSKAWHKANPEYNRAYYLKRKKREADRDSYLRRKHGFV